MSLRPCTCSIEAKRTPGLDQNFARSKQSKRSCPLNKQDRRENKVQSPAGSKQKQTMLVSILARSKQKKICSKPGKIEEKTMLFSPAPNMIKAKRTKLVQTLRDQSKTNRIALNFTGSDRERSALFPSLGSIGNDDICRGWK
jgi:hypothetical protein